MSKYNNSNDESYNPIIKYNLNGELILDGVCWVDKDWLECYEWENEDMLWILDTIPMSDKFPENQYYCYNINKCSLGWTANHQVKFEL